MVFPYNFLYTQAVAYTTHFELGKPVVRKAFLFSLKRSTAGCVVLELVPLRGKNNFKPRPQSGILLLLWGSFQNFQQAPPSFLYGGGHWDLRCCGVAVLMFFYCGDAVNKISTCGVAVRRDFFAILQYLPNFFLQCSETPNVPLL